MEIDMELGKGPRANRVDGLGERKGRPESMQIRDVHGGAVKIKKRRPVLRRSGDTAGT